MKNILIAILLLAACYATAQEKAVSEILPSSSPAFTILGTTPTDISRPNNWNALQTSLYQNMVSNNSLIVPKNFSLEFYPYWLKDRPTFTYNDYLNQSGFSMRNLSFSVASSRTAFGSDSAQAMGIGFRLPVITGNRKTVAKTASDLTQQINTHRFSTLQWQSEWQLFLFTYPSGNTMAQFFADVTTNLATPIAPLNLWRKNAAAVRRLVEDTLKTEFSADAATYASQKANILAISSAYISNRNKDDATAITTSITEALKKVTQLEVSGAFSFAFPTNQFTNSRAARLAFWGVQSFDINKSGAFNGSVALRYLRDFAVDTVKAANNIDGILRLNLALGSRQKFMVSLLGTLRYRSATIEEIIVNGNKFTRRESGTDTKYVLDLSFKLSESVALSYSFGKNFSKDLFTVPNSLISFLNLFYAINTKVARTGRDAGGHDTFGFKN